MARTPKTKKKTAKKRAAARKKWLVFIDTNIFLDFYRLGGESAERQLQALERHKDSIITSEQIRMEFLKNRQKVIKENIKELRIPSMSSVPPIVTKYQPTEMLKKDIESAKKNHKKVKTQIEKVLKDPIRHDPVYQSLNRIFSNDGSFNLKRDNKLRFTIRARARKRFSLGYPPRKDGDTSIGDAFNWEHIIECALSSKLKHQILIVSRDNDYGIDYDDDAILNDWLEREFKERVSKRRKIELTRKLTFALKMLEEEVKQEDIEEEKNIIEEQKTSNLYSSEEFRRVRQNFEKTFFNEIGGEEYNKRVYRIYKKLVEQDSEKK